MASLAGRRLAELLQEQQEPFLLDVYLLENGYSSRILCSEATATCWPAGNACRRLHRLASHGFRRRGEGILGSFLGVFARRRPPKASNWRRGALEEGGSSLSSMGRKTHSTGEDGRELAKIKVDAAERALGWECTEEAKQLSPVSVLELHSDDGSPAHDHCTMSLSAILSLILHLRLISCLALVALRTAKEEPSTSGVHAPGVMEVLEELHGSASSKYMGTKKELYGRRQALVACVKEGEVEGERSHQSEQKVQHLHDSFGSHTTGKARRRQDFTRRRRERDDIAASHLTESNVLRYSRKWNEFNSHVMEIGAEVGAAILHELIEDLVSHM